MKVDAQVAYLLVQITNGLSEVLLIHELRYFLYCWWNDEGASVNCRLLGLYLYLVASRPEGIVYHYWLVQVLLCVLFDELPYIADNSQNMCMLVLSGFSLTKIRIFDQHLIASMDRLRMLQNWLNRRLEIGGLFHLGWWLVSWRTFADTWLSPFAKGVKRRLTIGRLIWAERMGDCLPIDGVPIGIQILQVLVVP